MHWAGTWENILFFGTYLPAGPLTWMVFTFANFHGRNKMLLLDKPRNPPKSPPLLSIMIPAKDEEGRIRACLQSALDQDYSNFELIAIDDRSTDRTGAIMDEMAAVDPRLSVLHIQPNSLAPGWTGKNNALFQAVRQARGKWLLFVDSDVILEPTAASRSVTLCNAKDYDLFSVLPRLETHTPWEWILIPLCSAAAASMYMISLNNVDKTKLGAFANGQFMMMKRTAYDAIGGHETVKDRFCEDTEIARLIKENGMRSRVAMGDQVCAVRMYNSLSNIIKGWSRIYYAARVGQMRHLLSAMWFLLTSCFPVYFVMVYGIHRALHPHGNMLDDAWVSAAVIHLALITVVLAFVYKWSHTWVWNALLFPISGPMLFYVFVKAVILCITKKVEWRGTVYSHQMVAGIGAPISAKVETAVENRG